MPVQKKKKKAVNTQYTCFKSVPHVRQSVGTRPVESNPVFIRTPQHPPHLYHTFNSTCWCLCVISI